MGVLIEIPGQEGNEKAKKLLDKLKEKLGDTDVAITRPMAQAEIRVTGLDESATKDEVKDMIAYYGDCSVDEIDGRNKMDVQRTRHDMGAMPDISCQQRCKGRQDKDRMDCSEGRIISKTAATMLHVLGVRTRSVLM